MIGLNEPIRLVLNRRMILGDGNFEEKLFIEFDTLRFNHVERKLTKTILLVDQVRKRVAGINSSTHP